ncbi:hypothetical protein [Curtobacterium sp. VKM Ac-2884]|uniref:hypothetical protein n=1 Tax=Curtobacterium sp. VKM Ac-2884 TaxID=2783818 RepID=UPI00188B3A8E|nr:hypothetical protein [Curtobacterium sp. VKM Ac-2884]MBF4602843.1 hypothetical protein [Curtobacterium sp. VKM Ac-2884]
MTDPTVPDAPADSAGIEPQLPTYPDSAIGTLMWQRDQAKASADSNRLLSAQILESAAESDAKAVQLQAAIDSLGGDTA